MSGWTTTAGINTTLALDDPDAVLAAYPEAAVIINPLFGNIERVTDYRLGIDIDDIYGFIAGRVVITMAVSEPREPPPPPPPPEEIVRVRAVDLIGTKNKGDRRVTASVGIRDRTGYGAPGATVTATWTLPKGTTLEVEGTTDDSGWVLFRLYDVRSGWYALAVDDVVLGGHRFDRDASVLTGSARVK